MNEQWMDIIGWIIVGSMASILFVYGLFMLSAYLFLKEKKRTTYHTYQVTQTNEKYFKPLSILVPAYNEQQTVIRTVDSLLGTDYPEYEIIVINDGSKDQTLATLIDAYEAIPIQFIIKKTLKTQQVRQVYQSKSHPHLFIVDKENGGKFDALNVGINCSKYPYIGALDADSMIEKEGFYKVVRPIMQSEGAIIAAGGTVRVSNGNRLVNGKMERVHLIYNPFIIMQVIEYLRSFFIGRIGLSRYNLLLIISGAFGVFEKKALLEVNGYSDSIGEDMEVVMKLHRKNVEEKWGKKIEFIYDSVCWTEAPQSYQYLRKQRIRWQKGLLESLWKHRRMSFNPKYGKIGLVSLPYYILIELIGPIVEGMGYLLLIYSVFTRNALSEYAILFFLLSIIYGTVFSVLSVLFEEWTSGKFNRVRDLYVLIGFALTENFWYRPINVVWRLTGMISLLWGNKSWGEMKRYGD